MSSAACSSGVGARIPSYMAEQIDTTYIANPTRKNIPPAISNNPVKASSMKIVDTANNAPEYIFALRSKRIGFLLKRRPKANAPITFEMLDPTTIPRPREGCCCRTDATTTASWSDQRLADMAKVLAYLLPFRPLCEQSYKRLRYTAFSYNYGRIACEEDCACLKEEEAGDECTAV